MNEKVPSGESKERIFLLDGTYTVFRSFYGISPLTAPDGRPTGAVFGFVATVRKFLRDHRPELFVVAFDVEGPTQRDALFDQYKANRAAPPEELVPQFALAEQACEAMNWPVITAPGYEADDVIASLARQAREAGLEVTVITADKDLYQLVRDGVSVLNPAKEDRVLDADGIVDLFGVRPDQVVDVLALMGDKVDNVPGVPGIGEKGAKRIIKRYGDLDTALERAARFAGLWRLHLVALDRLSRDDIEGAWQAVRELAPIATELAGLERRAGGEEGEDLGRRFETLALLAGQAVPPAVKELRRALKDVEKKTQPKTWLALAEHQEQAEFSRTLVTIDDHVPVELDLAGMKVGEPRLSQAAEFFRELGFRRLSEEFEQAEGERAGVAADEIEVRLARSAEELEPLLPDLREARLLAVDTETTSLDPRRARLVGISLAASATAGVYVAIETKEGRVEDWPRMRELLRGLLGKGGPPKVAQNAKFDAAILDAAGLPLDPLGFETLIASQLVEPGRVTSHKLDDLAWRWLGKRMISYGELAGSGEQELTLDQVDVRKVARYAVEDAVVTWRLAEVLAGQLDELGLRRLFEEIELPLVDVLRKMEACGIRLDGQMLQAMSAELADGLAALEQEIHSIAGHSFNVGSPQQLRTVLFDELGLSPTGRRTQKTKAHSTGQEALEALAGEHPLPAKVLEYRELAKLKSTYVDALPQLVDQGTGRVHTQFHQLGAATGRLSSSDPNLQNIPVRTALGRRIREAFITEEGWRLISADYSQMELRILAHMARDEVLIDAFRRGLDIHRYTASLVEGIPLEEVDSELRSRAKAVNFGIIYGMSEFRLAREQGIARGDARRFIEAYFERYAGVRAYIERVQQEVQQNGEVRTLLGRRRPFPELQAADSRLNRGQREQLLRQAVNTTIQGTAADIVKRAMVLVGREIERLGLAGRLLLQVHDELVLEAPESEVSQLEVIVRSAMEGAVELEVPLTVEIRAGTDWASIH